MDKKEADPTNDLLERIKRELQDYIKDGEAKEAAANVKDQTDANKAAKATSTARSSVASGIYVPRPYSRPSTTTTIYDSEASYQIDENMKQMQRNLQQSYELYTSLGSKFAAIDFGRLQSRIKDLNLKEKCKEAISPGDVLKDVIKDTYNTTRTELLTAPMDNNKFRSLPGEYGEVPEIGAFVEACSELQMGLANLKKQNSEDARLAKRADLATSDIGLKSDKLKKF